MNPLFTVMGGNQPNVLQMLQQLKSNPAQFIMNSKYKIPQNMMNDPSAMIQHLLSSGQVSQDAVNRAYTIARQFGK